MLFSSLNRKTLVKITFVLFILQSGKIDDDGSVQFRCYSIASSSPTVSIHFEWTFSISTFSTKVNPIIGMYYSLSLSRKTYVFFVIIHLIWYWNASQALVCCSTVTKPIPNSTRRHSLTHTDKEKKTFLYLWFYLQFGVIVITTFMKLHCVVYVENFFEFPFTFEDGNGRTGPRWIGELNHTRTIYGRI